MNRHHFSLLVSDPVELTAELADRLYSAGCEDATPGMFEGVIILDFHRVAATLEEAIRTAIADVRSAGLDVARVHIDVAAVAPPG